MSVTTDDAIGDNEGRLLDLVITIIGMNSNALPSCDDLRLRGVLITSDSRICAMRVIPLRGVGCDERLCRFGEDLAVFSRTIARRLGDGLDKTTVECGGSMYLVLLRGRLVVVHNRVLYDVLRQSIGTTVWFLFCVVGGVLTDRGANGAVAQYRGTTRNNVARIDRVIEIVVAMCE